MEWVVAYDDLLTQRVRSCTDCGDRRSSTTWVGVWDLACGHSVASLVCGRCKPRDGGEEALRAKLEKRYARMA